MWASMHFDQQYEYAGTMFGIKDAPGRQASAARYLLIFCKNTSTENMNSHSEYY